MMTPNYILEKSLCRPAHCASEDTDRQRAHEEIENMTYAPEYAELGYTQPRKGILFANWNYFSGDVADLLEKYGFECEWSDEWSTCGDCGKAVRTSPDSYEWQASYAILNECDLTCHECIESDPIDYLAGLEDNPRQAVTLREVDPADHGYTLIESDFENGFHPGQTDDPKAIYARLSAEGKQGILFRIDSVGQFDVMFSVYAKSDGAKTQSDHLG